MLWRRGGGCRMLLGQEGVGGGWSGASRQSVDRLQLPLRSTLHRKKRAKFDSRTNTKKNESCTANEGCQVVSRRPVRPLLQSATTCRRQLTLPRCTGRKAAGSGSIDWGEARLEVGTEWELSRGGGVPEWSSRTLRLSDFRALKA